MKIRILLTTLGMAALAAITLNVNAGDGLLSPRTAGNQIKTTPVISIVSAAPVISVASPRALEQPDHLRRQRGERRQSQLRLPQHDRQCEGNSSLCGESHGRDAVLRQTGCHCQLTAFTISRVVPA